MHVISMKRLREFWERYPDAESLLRRWYKMISLAGWRSIIDSRRDLPHADPVTVASGRKVTVFHIAGNKYRLIAAITTTVRRPTPCAS